MIGVDRLFKSANRALCELWGREESALVGRSYLAVEHPGNQRHGEEIEGALAILTGERDVWTGRRRYVRPDDSEFTATARLTQIGTTAKPYLLLELFDVTEDPPHPPPEEPRPEGQQWLRSVVAKAPVTFVALDLRGHVLLVEGSIDETNRAKLTAADGDQTIYETFADRPDVLDAFRQARHGADV
nr:PAS domain-containing protein [Micromonospora sp. DSM 115978]